MYKIVTPVAEKTATFVSEPINVRKAKKVTFSFKRTGHSTGSGIFSIQASIDGVNDFIPTVNMISNDVNNHSQTLERNRTVELTSNSHVFTALDLEHFGYDNIQVKLTENGTGTSTCKMLVEYED